MSDRLKYERFLWFHDRIKSGRYPNAARLAEEFEISPRTAQRDIDFFRCHVNAPLKYDRHRRGYEYTDHTFELPPNWINETNVLALALAVRLASTIPDLSFKANLCNLINRVVDTSGKTGESSIERVSNKISVKNIAYSKVDEWCFRETVQAFFDDRALKITYFSPYTVKISERNVQPLHLMHYMGSWHLLAWCAVRRDIRDFALSRIRRIELLRETIPLPDDLPSLKEYTRKYFGIMQGAVPIEIVLRFSPKSAPLMAEQIWHPDQKTFTEPDGALLLKFMAADFRELVKKILSHGSEVKVISPLELKNLVKEKIKKMGKIY